MSYPEIPLEIVDKILLYREEHPLAKIISNFNEIILNKNVSNEDLFNYVKNKNDNQVPPVLLIYIMKKYNKIELMMVMN